MCDFHIDLPDFVSEPEREILCAELGPVRPIATVRISGPNERGPIPEEKAGQWPLRVGQRGAGGKGEQARTNRAGS